MCARLRGLPDARVVCADVGALPFAAARERIDAEGTFRIRKHTVLITARSARP
jgi:hypothetical protein